MNVKRQGCAANLRPATRMICACRKTTNRELVVRPSFVALLLCVSAMIAFEVADFPSQPGRLANASERVDAPKRTPEPTAARARATQPVPLNKSKSVLLDVPGKRLLLKTEVVLREGLLEMLCCLKQSKEHESILAVNSEAYVVHAGLLSLGAKVGTPVRYDPSFKPPAGQEVAIFLQWTDKKGKLHRVSGQSWIRHAIHRFYVAKLDSLPDGLKIPEDSELRYDRKFQELSWYGPISDKQYQQLQGLSNDSIYRKAIHSFYEQSRPRSMEAKWVFAGSGFSTDDKSGKQLYWAEGGDLICVANFPSATLDVAKASSSQGRENLMFEAYTERIPPLGTKVTVELIPVAKKQNAKKDDEKESGGGEASTKN